MEKETNIFDTIDFDEFDGMEKSMRPGGIELPFDVLTFRWQHGNQEYPADL